MKITYKNAKPRTTAVLHELKEGFNYASGFAPLRYIMLLLALVSFIGMPYSVLMPVFARKILHGGPITLGLLMAAAGSGALTGAVYLASRKNARGLTKIIPLAEEVKAKIKARYEREFQNYLQEKVMILISK